MNIADGGDNWHKTFGFPLLKSFIKKKTWQAKLHQQWQSANDDLVQGNHAGLLYVGETPLKHNTFT